MFAEKYLSINYYIITLQGLTYPTQNGISHHIIITMTIESLRALGILSIVIMLFEYSDCFGRIPWNRFLCFGDIVANARSLQFLAIFSLEDGASGLGTPN